MYVDVERHRLPLFIRLLQDILFYENSCIFYYIRLSKGGSHLSNWQLAQTWDCFFDFGRKLVNLRLPGNTQWCSATDGRTRQHRVMEDSLLPFTSLWENLTQAGLDFLIFVQRNKTDTALCNLSIKMFKCTIWPQHHMIRLSKNEIHLLII